MAAMRLMTEMLPCRFPKLGAYAAFGVTNAEGRIQALLCADTLIPSGSGQALTGDDRYRASWEKPNAHVPDISCELCHKFLTCCTCGRIEYDA